MTTEAQENLIHINDQLLIKVAALEDTIRKLRLNKTVFIVKEWSYNDQGTLICADYLVPYESMGGIDSPY